MAGHRLLAALAEHEIAERDRRRIERHLAEARLPSGKTLGAFDFTVVPMISQGPHHGAVRRRQLAQERGQSHHDRRTRRRESHLAAAIGMALIEAGWRVLSTRTSDLVQNSRSRAANLPSKSAIAKLDKYHLLVLDDLAYVTKNQAETSVLFELISARYERRSTVITANQPFGDWSRVFPEPNIS